MTGKPSNKWNLELPEWDNITLDWEILIPEWEELFFAH
jgi:hypothetical protein